MTYLCGKIPDKCQLSGEPFNGVIYDANLLGVGWGYWCFNTFQRYGGKLGMGYGQKYRKQDDGRWLKIG